MRALLALATLTLGGTALAQSAPYFVREGMVQAINPPITAIWDLQAEVMDDEGNFSPALMDEAKWVALIQQARALDQAVRAMADAGRYASHDPAGSLGEAPEGTDLVAVQARLAANPEAFRAFARAMAENTGAMLAAAEARDTVALTTLVNDAQPACKACHNVFWYPEEY